MCRSNILKMYLIYDKMRLEKFFLSIYPKIWPFQNVGSAVDSRFRNYMYFNGRGLKILVFRIAMD